MPEYRRPQRLDLRAHDRRTFECGEPVLDEWLRRYAGQNRRGNTAAIWVVVDRDNTVVAYTSLSMTAVDVTAASPPLAKNAPDPIPALLLGRVGVDRRHAGQGLGTALVTHVLATAVELNQRAACRAVVVTAINESSRGWWEYLGFSPMDPDDPESLDLYLLTADIEATLDAME